jgi:hypothetical protein
MDQSGFLFFDDRQEDQTASIEGRLFIKRRMFSVMDQEKICGEATRILVACIGRHISQPTTGVDTVVANPALHATSYGDSMQMHWTA